MKIIQLNIWQGKLGRQIIDFLQSEKPDFVCMQEVNDLKGRAGYKFFNTLDEIKQQAGFKEAVMSASYSSRYMEREMEYGNAVLSQWPIVNSQKIFTRGEYMRNFDIEKNDDNVRNLQIINVNVGDKPLTILNHHGHHIHGSALGNDETLRQMRLIATEIDKIKGPLIMCGDFNLSPDSESLAIVNQKLTNLTVANDLQNTLSRLHPAQGVACDYIFVNDQIKVKNFEMSAKLVSDHKALILEFDL